MIEFTTLSGAQVVINPAEFFAASALWRAMIAGSLERKISLGNDLDFLILALADTEDFSNKIWPCLLRCTRDNKKIESATFEGEEGRKEYYEIIVPCARINVRPFYEGLSLGLEKRMKEITKKTTESAPE